MPFKDKQKAKEYAKEYRSKRKDISRAYQKQYVVANKEKLAHYKADWYKRKRYDRYGITREEFDSALIKQNHNCAICAVGFSDKNRCYIDHCHTTGKVRGILCFHCNTGLGHFKDKQELLTKALNYLNDNPFCYS